MSARRSQTCQGASMEGRCHHAGHLHLWQRALSRRRFVQAAAGATVGVLAADLWAPLLPRVAEAAGSDPKPIPDGIQPFGAGTETFHLFLPAPGFNPSTITDFSGLFAFAEVQGTGTGTDTSTGATTPLLFDADMRFYDGAYLGMDGRPYAGTFGFV